jgi:superfamily II DNA helicase RecQ
MTVVVSPLLALIFVQMASLPGGLTSATVSGAATKQEVAKLMTRLALAKKKMDDGVALVGGDLPNVLFLTPEAIGLPERGQYLLSLLKTLGSQVRDAEVVVGSGIPRS